MILSAALAAYALPYVCFYTIEGGEVPMAVEAEGLVITVDGDNLVATPTVGNVLTLPLSTLTAMEFSTKTLGVAEMVTSDGSPFLFFSLDGVSLGSFPSLEEASSILSPGIYLVRHNNSAFKLLVNR